MTKAKIELPIVDWEQETQIAPNISGLTFELLNMFAKDLPGMRQTINHAYSSKNYKLLSDQLHKLQGGCIYCGLLRLRATITEVSTALHNNTLNDSYINELNQQMDAVTNELKTKGIN